MEFLIGRSLTNNITNLMLSSFVRDAVKQASLDWLGLLEEEPDAGLGNGGLGRLAACFLDSMATMQLPAMGYGLRYEYGMFRQSIEGGWQHEEPDNWLRRPDPWEVVRPDDRVEIKLNCSVEVRDGALSPIAGRPSTLIGIPFDRPVVGYGGKTINTLRLWAASVPVEFDFQTFSHGEFISALAGSLAAKSLTRSRTWPRCSPSASATRPTASRRVAGCCWRTRRSRASSPRPSATSGSPTSASWRSSSRWPTIGASAARFSGRSEPPSRPSLSGSARPRGRRRIRTPSSTARSSASTSTSVSSSMPCGSSCSTTDCGRTRRSR